MRFSKKSIALFVSLSAAVSALSFAHARDIVRVRVFGCLAGSSATTQLGINKDALRLDTKTDLDQAMLEDITELNKVYGLNVPLYFSQGDEKLDNNACYMPVVFDDMVKQEGGDPNRTDGTVVFGLSLMKKEAQEGHGSLMSIPTILGHEYGHAMQFKQHFPYEGKWRELHADFMAGWFTAHRGRFRNQDPERSFESLFSKGDYGFYDRGHHGTPAERGAAFLAGYRLNVDRNVSSGQTAYSTGIRYLQSLGAH